MQIRRGLKGGSISPSLASRIMLYTYCITFHINPTDALQTPAKIIAEMLSIHGEVKKIESEEMDKIRKN